MLSLMLTSSNHVLEHVDVAHMLLWPILFTFRPLFVHPTCQNPYKLVLNTKTAAKRWSKQYKALTHAAPDLCRYILAE